MRNLTAIGIVLALSASAASAQTAAPAAPATAAAQLTTGAKIFDTSGAEVGTVDSVTPQAVVVNTGTNKVAIPPASFGPGANGPVLAATRAQLDEAATQAAAAAKSALMASLTPGANINGVNGASIGTVKAVEGDNVLVASPKGEVRVPVAGFSAGPNGLVLGMSAADFEAAVTAATKPAA